MYVDDEDRLPEMLASLDDPPSSYRALLEEEGVDLDLVRVLGALPSSYLRYYYDGDRILAEQRGGATPRAEQVMEIEAGLLDLYRDPSLDTKPKLLEQRGGAFYSDAAAALIASLHAGTGDAQVVNLRNDGAIPNLPSDAVVEITASIDREGAHPLATAPLAPEMHGLVSHAKAYELLAIEAAVGGSRTHGAEGAHDQPARRRPSTRETAVGRVAGGESLAATSILSGLTPSARFFPG